MLLKKPILLPSQTKHNDISRKVIAKAISAIGGKHIGLILKHNPYEKLVPFNLWFADSKYVVNDICGQNQHLRIRTYNSILLTPLVSEDNTSIDKIRNFVSVMSLYQPFYPETFYSVWEFLQAKYIRPDCKYFLHIGSEHHMGTIESIIFYHERYQQTYQHNIYHSWYIGDDKYDIIDNSYTMSMPRVNYLAQAYKVIFLESTNQLIKYDFITIGSTHMFESIFEWSTEELDLESLIFYLIMAMDALNVNGSILIRLNMICNESWNVVFEIVGGVFKDYKFFRPSVSNPFNSEVYLFLNKFDASRYAKWSTTVQCSMLKNMYRYKVYECFNLNFVTGSDLIGKKSVSATIGQKFASETKKWALTLNALLDHFTEPVSINADLVTKWHIKNGLKQISDLQNNFDNKPVCVPIDNVKEDIVIKPISAIVLYKQSAYVKLIEKRAELNYYKKVMDTKPSCIFAEDRYANRKEQSYMLTWERLTSSMSTYKYVVSMLKNTYRAEMVTNAWVKMYELINMFPELLSNNKTIKTFHLCEAPGAFIASLNHYLSGRNQTLDWYSQTLKPSKNSLALDDHYGLMAKYSDRWLYGDPKVDDSGDITHSAIIKYYRKHPQLKNIEFMTADAGIQCHPSDLNEQESCLGKINMGQIICILSCLSVGKSAIFKTFLPLSEPLNISLIYLLTHLFGSINIVKPTTSHSSNSEIYVVLKEYKGITESLLKQLYVLLDDPKITSKTLLFPQIKKQFFVSYMDTIGKLIDRQIQSLTNHYYYYYHLDEINDYVNASGQHVSEWFEKNRVNPLVKPLM